MQPIQTRHLGSYCGGFVDKWNWNEFEVKKLSEEDLIQLYRICKQSWK
jgi:hypothetical protein